MNHLMNRSNQQFSSWNCMHSNTMLCMKYSTLSFHEHVCSLHPRYLFFRHTVSEFIDLPPPPPYPLDSLSLNLIIFNFRVGVCYNTPCKNTSNSQCGNNGNKQNNWRPNEETEYIRQDGCRVEGSSRQLQR